MNDQEWTAFLDSLSPAHRRIAQGVLARLEYVLERFRSQTLTEQQAQARRSDGNAARISEVFDLARTLAADVEQLKERQADNA